MKTFRILTAAVVGALAFAAQAAPYGPGPGCPAGATPCTADCPGLGAGPGYGHGHGRHGARMVERFKAADTNADGMISREEAKAAAPRLNENFDAIDADKNGLLTQAEMQSARMAHRGAGMRGEGWKKWDANGDGMLSREEVSAAPRLSQAFDAIDTNRDGLLSVEEFQAARGAYGRRGPPS